MRGAAGQHHTSLRTCRWVVRFERSEQNDLLHCHILLWTGGPWVRSDAFRSNSLWRMAGNGTRHCTVYDGRRAGAAYIVKGLHVSDSQGLEYELRKSTRKDVGLTRGGLMIDDNTWLALQVNRVASRWLRGTASTSMGSGAVVAANYRPADREPSRGSCTKRESLVPMGGRVHTDTVGVASYSSVGA